MNKQPTIRDATQKELDEAILIITKGRFKPIDATCEVCERVYLKVARHQRFCSEACRQAYKHAKEAAYVAALENKVRDLSTTNDGLVREIARLQRLVEDT